MKIMKRVLFLILGLGCLATAEAQIRIGDGQLTGSFETNTIYYVGDDGLGLAGKAPDDRFGTNNYLKVDYSLGRFSAGIQADAYLPALQGYEVGTQPNQHNFYISSKYIQWQDKNFQIFVGDIFDQYGNGLIYRSFEDRQLGFNNSIEGIRAQYNFGRYVTLRGMYGRPRLYTEYADSWVRGADLSVSLSDIFGSQKMNLNVEGSYLNRYETIGMTATALGVTNPNLDMYSARLNLDVAGFNLRGEYAHKSKDIYAPTAFTPETGEAIYVELGYNRKGFSFSGQVRTLDNMTTMLSLDANGTGNALNYLPALTRQYTYMLANLEPYQVNGDGEIAGQIDLYYTYRSKTNRARYWNFHANFSTAYDKDKNAADKHELLWRDINVDVERQWNKKLKTSLLFSMQEWNPYKGSKAVTYVSNIVVADVTYKFNRKHSLRVEGQYLYSQDYQGDWVAGLVEYSFAPRWSFYFQNMYNLGDENEGEHKPLDEFGKPLKVYYYQGGMSYTKNRTRIQLSYGRNRAGYICSGGVCRYSPAYTGVNLALTTSF